MSQQIRVLYVDDDLDSLQIWADVLREHDGIEVVTETNMDDGLSQLSGGGIDCVLSDLTHPDGSNISFLETVRDSHPDVPFILFAEEKPDRTINEAIEAGATDYVPKSVAENSETLLISRIEQAVANDPVGADGRATSGERSTNDEQSGAEDELEVQTTEPPSPSLDLEPEPGSSTFVQCKSHNELKTETCTHLLGGDDLSGRDVVLIRYRSVDENRLAQLAEKANRLKLIAVGYTQSTPGSLEEDIELISIANPGDVTRLGIVTTGAVEEWASSPADTVVCFDSLNVLLRYKSVKKVFQFLHILLAKLEEADAVAHFHIDHTAEDIQEINSLKPIFDNIVKINGNDVHTEGGG